ncbi:Free fatty acid receptor 2 [Heterocephalus glaber]|uniref:Free fatty acid receptor 2 n=1 Tax=Heterocephalus glaber TaxID=10181 RepID=G5BXI8_HETGA|nr:Free fatty acid receptor 2 [Heterocephalus glaber]
MPTASYKDFTPEQVKFMMELSLVLFVIPVGVTIFCYWHFVRIMLSQSRVRIREHWRAVGLAAVTLQFPGLF